MRIRKSDMLLYIVTDRSWLDNRSLLLQVEDVLKAGATLLQLREKELPLHKFIQKARKIKKLTDIYKVPFIINDNVDVAMAVDSDGIHLGQEDEDICSVRKKLGSNKIIGISAHNVEEALYGERNGADYIGVGAVFGTSTKKDAKEISLETVKAICNAVKIPVVAIGGITKNNILKLRGTGIDGVAVISAVFAQPDIAASTRELARLSKMIVRSNEEII